MNLLRFLANLDPKTLKEEEWEQFTKRVLSSVPELAIMEMSLPELQSFTINFNVIRRRLGLQNEADFATQT